MNFPGNYSSDGRPNAAGPAPELRDTTIYGTLAADHYATVHGSGVGTMNVSPRSALSLAAYFAAINVLSTDLACLPMKVYRRRKAGGRDEVRDHPLVELLTVSPDGETIPMRWRQAMIGNMLGWGNGYSEIIFSGGEVSALYLLDPGAGPDRRDRDGQLYYRLADATTRPPYQILHIAGLGSDGLTGYSVARMARLAIELGLSAEAFGATFFANGLHTRGVFSTPHKLGSDAIETFRNSVNAYHAGPSNAHRFMVLEQGMAWTQTSISPDDAQFLATREFQVLEIARLFRLPPQKLGDYSQSHLANLEESNLDYKTTTLMPWCVSMEQEFNRKLFTPAERRKGFYLRHDMRAFQRGNEESRSSFYQTMFGLGVFTPNIIAELEDMNPIGDVGDERFLSVQAVPFKQALQTPEPDASPASPGFNPNHDPEGQFTTGRGVGRNGVYDHD